MATLSTTLWTKSFQLREKAAVKRRSTTHRSTWQSWRVSSANVYKRSKEASLSDVCFKGIQDFNVSVHQVDVWMSWLKFTANTITPLSVSVRQPLTRLQAALFSLRRPPTSALLHPFLAFLPGLSSQS
jgi:hypothetical protein